MGTYACKCFGKSSDIFRDVSVGGGTKNSGETCLASRQIKFRLKPQKVLAPNPKT